MHVFFQRNSQAHNAESVRTAPGPSSFTSQNASDVFEPMVDPKRSLSSTDTVIKLGQCLQHALDLEGSLRQILTSETKVSWHNKELCERLIQAQKKHQMAVDASQNGNSQTLSRFCHALDRDLRGIIEDIYEVRKTTIDYALRSAGTKATRYLETFALLSAIFAHDAEEVQRLVKPFDPIQSAECLKKDKEILQHFSSELLHALREMNWLKSFSCEEVALFQNEIKDINLLDDALIRIDDEMIDHPQSTTFNDKNHETAVLAWRQIKITAKAKILLQRSDLGKKKALLERLHNDGNSYFGIADNRYAWVKGLASMLPDTCRYRNSKQSAHQMLVHALPTRHMDFFWLLGAASRSNDKRNSEKTGYVQNGDHFYRFIDDKFKEIASCIRR